MNMPIRFFKLISVGLGLTLISLPANAEPSGTATVKQAMALAAKHLTAIQESQGRFAYDFDFKSSAQTGKDNIVRQAGTTYGLAEYFREHPSPKIEETLRRAIGRLQNSSIPYGNGDGRLVSLAPSLDKAYSGATALALLAELYYRRTVEDDRFKNLRSQWLNGLLAMRIKGRGFPRTPIGKRESDYFNGESWLALAVHHDMFSDPVAGRALAELDTYFTRKYAANPKIGFFHWGVMAAAMRYQTTKSTRFLDFIYGQTKYFLDTLRPAMHPRANTCYALEGLITASAVLSDRRDATGLRSRLAKRIAAEVKKNLALQVKPGSTVKPRLDQKQTLPIPDAYIGSFLGRSYAEYTRIDYTQHCLSALTKLHVIQRRRETASVRQDG